MGERPYERYSGWSFCRSYYITNILESPLIVITGIYGADGTTWQKLVDRYICSINELTWVSRIESFTGLANVLVPTFSPLLTHKHHRKLTIDLRRSVGLPFGSTRIVLIRLRLLSYFKILRRLTQRTRNYWRSIWEGKRSQIIGGQFSWLHRQIIGDLIAECQGMWYLPAAAASNLPIQNFVYLTRCLTCSLGWSLQLERTTKGSSLLVVFSTPRPCVTHFLLRDDRSSRRSWTTLNRILGKMWVWGVSP